VIKVKSVKSVNRNVGATARDRKLACVKRHRFDRVAAALVYNFAVFRGIRGCAAWRTIGYP